MKEETITYMSVQARYNSRTRGSSNPSQSESVLTLQLHFVLFDGLSSLPPYLFDLSFSNFVA
ncbi:hypothetical protein, partial [Escherichia coli]|uniref:hypothetical protein n=1 Tax=Escherichia coli TaxID=562 RepID=UPI001BDBAD06